MPKRVGRRIAGAATIALIATIVLWVLNPTAQRHFSRLFVAPVWNAASLAGDGGHPATAVLWSATFLFYFALIYLSAAAFQPRASPDVRGLRAKHLLMLYGALLVELVFYRPIAATLIEASQGTSNTDGFVVRFFATIVPGAAVFAILATALLYWITRRTPRYTRPAICLVWWLNAVFFVASVGIFWR